MIETVWQDRICGKASLNFQLAIAHNLHYYSIVFALEFRFCVQSIVEDLPVAFLRISTKYHNNDLQGMTQGGERDRLNVRLLLLEPCHLLCGLVKFQKTMTMVLM